MSIDWTPLADLIERHDRYLVTTHVRPDGDALGSEVGMAGLLRERGKDVRVVNASRTPPRYDFLDPAGTLFERNTLGRLRLMAETLSGLRTESAGRIAYATVTRSAIERTGAIPHDTEDLIDFTVSLSGVEVGLLFLELARGGIKLRLRSRGD